MTQEKTKTTEGTERITETLFNIRVAIRYHMRRAAFYSLWHRLTGLFSLIFGSAAFASIIGENSAISVWLSAGIVVAQSLDLMFETAKNSITHEILRQKYIKLESKLLHKAELSTEEYRSAQQDIKHLEIEEPPIKRWLLRECVNTALDVSGYNKDDPDEATHYQRINWFQRIFKHVY